MAVPAAVLLLLLLLALLVPLAGLVLGTVLLGLPSYDIPAGVNQPAKLRLVLAVLLGTAALGRILEKTGLCSQITFGRYVRQGRRLRVDPKLFIQDLQFNKVPVRVYQPKATCHGRRRAILFFHGGGWVFGSLDTYEKVCRYLSRESESVVVSVQYEAEVQEVVYETVKRFCEPNLCPLLAEDAVVQSFILTCEYDVLRDDGLLYKKRLEDNGVRVTWCHLEDGFHGIISLYDYEPSPTTGVTVTEQPGKTALVRQRNTSEPKKDGEDWWKVQPKYSTKVLIGNWLEERKRFIKPCGKLGCSVYSTDFTHFPDHKPERTLRATMMKKYEGLPAQHFFTHHEEPRSRHLVSEYEDNYNRHGYVPFLPPLRSWNGRKFAWVPQKSDFPILEPPTNYGLLEHLKRKWHRKEAGVMNSIYTISYEKPPVSAFAPCQFRRAAKPHGLSSRRGQLPHVSRILDYEGGQRYLQALSQLVRDTKVELILN
uniref:Alpha/beta hydrolase fold-3 domain-containing protein n=1 Tax=Phasianus colchicus TaxID=9054 RepID=A0A669R521_PHACC